ncbi:MAG: Ig-like domain-containing protein [Bacteroidales bacterium]|nr:Ig-like domain-containing protein [Bacteroidales bacterium]
MKRFTLFIVGFIVSQLFYFGALAQINSGSPTVPFGKNTNYKYGIMPTNLPAGTYGGATKAGEAYEAWKTAYVRTCSGGQYRVLFDDGSATVSEGIAYGMLLSVYASDKAVFDGLWAYYKANSNGNGVMNWKIGGCTGVTGANGATDAELDAAMALIIAAEQWSAQSATYTAEARTLIKKIKQFEMTGDGQTLNGDAWGNTNTCRNPSYFSPGYYKEFAKIDSENATFWNTTAINASNTLLTANRNSTSGLVSNWCDNAGTENSCGNTGSGAAGYGADACRNPWRTAVDYLWNGTGASTASKDINGKLINFVNGYESQLKGPLPNRSVSNPSSGSYVNGSYSTFALPTMTSAAAQSSLNKCYTSVASLANVDAYFNTTIRCISMFVLTGNFWAPGASGFVFPPAVTNAYSNETGTQIILTSNKPLSSTSATASTFTLYLNGSAQTGAITNVAITGTAIALTISASSTLQPGQTITVSYSGSGNITSTEGATMAAFTQMDVLNLLEGNETILDDCDDGNELNNVGGIWFTFNDTKDQNAACTPGTKSSITPLSSVTAPFKMTAPGYNTTAYAVNASFVLGTNYTPYNSGSCASWTNPSYVGLGTWVDDIETNTMDWTSGVGVTFWYKGPACSFQVIIEEVTDFCFHKFDVAAATNWTKITVQWGDLAQPTWGKVVPFSAKHVQKLQWQFEKGTSANTGEIWIDDVRILNMPPVALTAMQIAINEKSKLTKPLELPNNTNDTLKLEIITTPLDASYPVAFWSSSDEDVVTVDYQGRVVARGFGEATITARSKMHQTVTATYAVKVPAPAVKPTSITFTPNTSTLSVNQSDLLIPTFYSASGSVTETGLTWTSSNDAIVSVSSSGTITGKAVGGPVTITATSTADLTVKGTVTVTVVKTPVSEITVDVNPVEIDLGDSKTVVATVLPESASDKSVTWSSADESIATVADGVISSVGAGSTTITVTSVDNPAIKVEIPVTVIGIGVTSVTISPKTLSLTIGAFQGLDVEVLPLTATQSVTWSSSDDNIATVSLGGVVTAIALGEVNIIVTSVDNVAKKDTCVVTVNPVLALSITVDPATFTLYTDATTTVSATVGGTGVTDATYTWSSSNETIATVDANGKVTPVAVGFAYIIATTNDGSNLKDTCIVTVAPRLVSTITVTADAVEVAIGKNTTVSAAVEPSTAKDKTYAWSSSNEAIATVNASGLVTAIAKGIVTITATANDASAVKGTIEISVIEILPTSVTTSPEIGFVLGVDPSQTLTATVSPNDVTNDAVVWSSDNELVATVNATTGEVTPVGLGTCNIKVTCVADNTVSAVCEVTVSDNITHVASVTLSEETLNLGISDEATLTATVLPGEATNKAVTWSSSNATIASVSNGKVTANALGEAYIFVTTTDGNFKDSCKVTVSATAVTGVTLDKTVLSLAPTSLAVTLKATVAPAEATNQNVTWSSDDEAVVTVSQSGVVTVKGLGNAVVTVTTQDGNFTAVCSVSVSAIPVQTITLSETTLNLTTASSNVTLVATVAPESASDKSVTWSTSDATVVKVSTSGVVSVVGAGSATIKATANDGSLVEASCIVVVSAIHVSGIELSESEWPLTLGSGNKTLTATVSPSDATNKNYQWSVSPSGIVSVTFGIVSPLAVGEAYVYVTTQDGAFKDSCKFTVSGTSTPVTSVELNKSTVTLQLSETTTSLVATVKPSTATNKNVTWSSTNTSVVTVNNLGKLTPVAKGDAMVIVITEEGLFRDTCYVTITDILATSVSIKNALILTIGGFETLTATVSPTGASQSVTWSSSNSLIASVDANGKVTANAAGSAIITATTTDGTSKVSNDCNVSVSAVSVTGVTLSPSSIIVDLAGSAVSLTATVGPENATNKAVTWSAAPTGIVNVSATSVSVASVAPVAAGKTVITVRTEDGLYTAKCSVEVITKAALSAKISEVQGIYTLAQEGTAIGQYVVGSKAELYTAITTAQAVLSSTTNTQAQIDAGLAALVAAEANFQKKKIVDETVIFDAEHDNMTLLATYWFSFDDSQASKDPLKVGKSVVSPKSDSLNPFTMTAPGSNGTGNAAVIDYSLDGSVQLGYSPFVGMGMPLNKESDKLPLDLTGSTGIKFTYKASQGYYLEIALATITDDCNYYFEIPASTTWKTIEISWSEFKQYTWGAAKPWDLSQIVKLQWKVQTVDGTVGQLSIDNVAIKGIMLELPSIVVKTALDEVIVSAQKLHDDATEGTGNGQYEVGSKAILQAAIDAAKVVSANENATQEQVDLAETTLEDAVTVFENSLVGEVDKTALDKLIVKAQTIVEFAPIGTQLGDYTQQSVDALKLAILVADNVLDNRTATVDQVDQAIKDLTKAITVFENSKLGVNVNRAALESLLSSANLLVEYAESGILKGRYPEFAINDLKSAIYTAQKIYNDGTSTQVAIDATYDYLSNALDVFETFRDKVDVTEVNIEISVYPNPATSYVIIEASEEMESIVVTSILGYTEVIKVGTSTYKYDITGLSLGEYILTIKLTDGSVKPASFIKK